MHELGTTEHPSRLKQSARTGVALLALAATFVLGGQAFTSTVQIHTPRPRADIQIGIFANKQLEAFRRSNVPYLFLGDSLSMPNTGGGQTPQMRVANAIRKAEGAPNFRNLSLPGMTVFSYYFLNESIAAVGAEKIILGFNMGWFARPAHHQPLGLEGFLPVRQWLSATQLPLHHIGLTAADVVSAGMIDQLGLRPERKWLQKMQADVSINYRNFVRQFQIRVGAPGGMYGLLGSRQLEFQYTEHGERLRANAATKVSGPVLDGLTENEPGLLVLGELIRRLRKHRSEVLVVAQPMNVDHLRALGVVDESALDESIRQLRNVAESNGADFLDLHAALPDQAFRDAMDHVKFRGSSNPSRTMADPMLDWLTGS